MIVNKFLEQLNEEVIFENTFKAGIIPSDGIIEGFPEIIVSFEENDFFVYVFEGIFKPKFKNKYEFLFSDIKEIEMGKYNFKDPYIKLIFNDDKHFTFTYLLKQRKYPKQKKYLMKFIDKLYEISNKEE